MTASWQSFLDEMRDEWRRQLRDEGHKKGRAEGHTEGWSGGEAAALLRLLSRRFGHVPGEIEERVRGAHLGEVQRWFDRAITADDLEGVFDPRDALVGPTALSFLDTILHATDFAARKHRGQVRKSGDTPYLHHPLSVARRLVAQGGVDDSVTIAAALLHDTVEDTDTTVDELVAEFGEEIAGVVAEVTDDKSLGKADRKREQIRHAREISSRARVVKLADKLDNLEDLSVRAPRGWSEHRVRGYFAWAFAVVENLRGVNRGLEEALDAVFAREVTADFSAPFRAVPADAVARQRLLDDYLESMAMVDD